VTANITAPTWLLWGATVLWTLGFDTIYAMSDRIDDKRIGINSSAIFFGKYAPTAIAIFLMGTVILLAGVGVLVHLKTAFWISLIFATIGWIWQITRLQQPKIPHSAYGEMFRQNVWIGFLILAGMIIGSF
jgi:4-hydroxybenzoate polyprenyltransferase